MSNQKSIAPVKDPTKTSIGDISTRDKVIDTFISKGESQVQEISVNYTDSDGSVRQDKIEKTGKVTQEGKITQKSAKSIYKQAERIKANRTHSDKFMAINAKDYDRIFGDNVDQLEPGKHIFVLDSIGKLVNK